MHSYGHSYEHMYPEGSSKEDRGNALGMGFLFLDCRVLDSWLVLGGSGDLVSSSFIDL